MVKLLKTNEYGETPNTYDLLKFVALVFMVIDHIGFYLFPDIPWLRAIGRVSFPIFLFLIGYSKTTRFDVLILLGAILVFINAGLVGTFIIPLNILFAILATRLLMHILDRSPDAWQSAIPLWIGFLLFYLPLSKVIEYGTLCFMFACLGRYTREGRNGETGIRAAWLFSLAFYLLTQQLGFEFEITYFVLMLMLVMVMGIGLIQFTFAPIRFPEDNISPTPSLHERIIMLVGRNTLPLYVLHVILLQWWGSSIYPKNFTQGFASLSQLFQ
ncbi:MAG: hypothetical protein FJX23_06410 [Alphaproteobacteria bacterium]|nr:hypothetical protein [Alphaproteobacteria bacterium]